VEPLSIALMVIVALVLGFVLGGNLVFLVLFKLQLISWANRQELQSLEREVDRLRGDLRSAESRVEHARKETFELVSSLLPGVLGNGS
jgi:hypothetical protein